MWTLDKSKGRVSKQWDDLAKSGITVKKLKREMDLSNLPLNEARQVHGAHLYVDIANLQAALEDPTLRSEHFKPLHRYLHVLRVEMRRIVQAIFDADKIQIQGGKFHALLFKPYDDDGRLAWNAVLLGIALNLTLREALPLAFPDYIGLIPTVGIDLGDTIVANIGVRGDRELISVGSAANHAAKVLGPNNGLVVTEYFWKLLSEEQRKLFTKNGSNNYQLNWSSVDDAEQLLSENGFAWTALGSAAKMKATIANLPLKDLDSQEAKVRIDLGSLGPKNFKRCFAGTIYVDMDGYTKLVDSLMGDERKLAEAVKLLHLFRYELQRVTEEDFDGVVIQHQGDRLQAIIHLPCNDEERVREKVAEMCVSFNSSVEQILNVEYALFTDPVHVAIGATAGKTVIVRSGTIGDLDASCLGDSVLLAETLQLGAKGNEMRIAPAIYSAIGDTILKEFFVYQKLSDCYVATGLTWLKVEDKENTKALRAGAAMGFDVNSGRIEFGRSTGHSDGGNGKPSQVRPVKVTSNWAL